MVELVVCDNIKPDRYFIAHLVLYLLRKLVSTDKQYYALLRFHINKLINMVFSNQIMGIRFTHDSDLREI